MYTCDINGIKLEIETGDGVFSPAGADTGTLEMLSDASACNFGGRAVKILDLGCGAGVVGIYLGRLFENSFVFMTDKDPRCVDISRRNAAKNGLDESRCRILESDAFDGIGEYGFDLILSNPPYHTDFSVAKRFIEGAFRHLSVGGRLLMVTKRLDWYRNKIINVFGGVKVRRTGDGYYVFSAEKRSERPAGKRPNKHRQT